MKKPTELGVDDKVQKHQCLKCGEPFGAGVLMKFLTAFGDTDIQCPACFQAHEFDDEKAKLMPLLIFFLVFLTTGGVLAFLALYQWRQAGMLFYIQLVLPLIAGFIAGGFASKAYQWKTQKLTLFGR